MIKIVTQTNVNLIIVPSAVVNYDMNALLWLSSVLKIVQAR